MSTTSVPLDKGEVFQVPSPISPPPGSFAVTTSGRFFLDLFAGRNSPISDACRLLSVDRISPLDFELGWDILDDFSFEKILHLSWNGFVGGAWSAPPCREYSRLKLKPNGLQALRTPSQPEGRDDLTPHQMHRLQEDEEIHRRGRLLLQAAHCKGATIGWETPPTAMTLLLKDNTEMLRDWNATCSHVAACHWGMNLSKAWLMCSNDAAISSLACWCECPQKHPSFAGVRKPDGSFVSSDTAQYPAALAMAVAQIVTKKCTFQGEVIPWNQPLQHQMQPHPKQHLNDGGGLPSSADWTKPHRADLFASLRGRLWDYGLQHNLVDRLMEHLQAQRPEPPFSEEEINPLKQIAHHWSQENGMNLDWSIAKGQHFRLQVLQTWAQWTQDADVTLHYHLQQGVPTGVLNPIDASHIWPRKPSSDQPDAELHSFLSNWSGADVDPQLTWDLINEEISQGWVEELPGGLPQAQNRWKHIAVGKLNVVHAEGRKPRLVLDSPCCGVNPKVVLPETMVLPTVDDVRAAFQPSNTGGDWLGCSLDIQAAHKQIRLHEQDQGLVMFSFQGRFFHYKVAHFGGKFSAFWWSRLGALLMRLLHTFLHEGHRSWLYVDDLLLVAKTNLFREKVWSTVVFLMLLNTPISWKKAQLGSSITWIGWDFNLYFLTVELTPDKLEKLRVTIQNVLVAKLVAAKQLEQVLGLLIWFSSVARHLRPHLAPIYKDLYSPPATLVSIPATSWPAFLDCLSDQAVFTRQHPHFHFPLGGRVIEVGHCQVSCKLDLPKAPKTSKLQWIRVSGPSQNTTKLSKEARKKLQWFLSIINRQCHVYSIPIPPTKVLRAAADAFAEHSCFGVGGWIITAQHVCWFSEQFEMDDIRPFLPSLTKEAQRYISAFEILAQLILLMMAKECIQCDRMEICIPSSSDNTSAESSLNRQLSNKEPAATFLQKVSEFALQNRISLSISHIAGYLNTWADDLSRNRLDQWKHYPRFRVSIQQIFDIGRKIHLFPPGEHPPWLTTLTVSNS